MPSAMWGSADGTLVLYVQYDDSAVSELKFPRLSEGIGGASAARSGFLLPALNNTLHSVFPDHVTIRYPTVSCFSMELLSLNTGSNTSLQVI